MESLNLLLLVVVAVVAATAAAVAAAEGRELWLEGKLKRLLHLPKQTLRFTVSHQQYCGSRSGIRCLFDPWIWNPRRVKSHGSGSGMNNPDHISEILKNNILG
jgi:hypothetical protein